MYAEITAAFATLKSISEFLTLAAKAQKDRIATEKAMELNFKIIDIQNTLSMLQTQNQNLSREKSDLEQRIADMENWKRESRRYILHEIAPRVFVYVLNEKLVKSGEPNPWLCTNCYQKRQKSILQRGEQTGDGTYYNCPNCKTKILDHSDYLPLSYEVG